MTIFDAHGSIKKPVSMKGLVKTPKRTKNSPLLVFLHGMGCQGQSIDSLVPEELGFTHLAPICPNEGSWVADDIYYLIDRVVHGYQLNKKRIYLTGFSMGARGVWNLATSYPDKFAAIMPISGYACYIDAPKIANVPAMVFHGTEDDTVPFIESVKMVRAMRESGGKNVHFYPIKGCDHGVPLDNIYKSFSDFFLMYELNK
jgi:predicted peptidase